jgi:uncharacterized protein (DUF1778 family)
MPRRAVEDNSRMFLRTRAAEKATLLRAAALNHTGLTDFVLRHALLAAKAVIEHADYMQLSERDSLRVLDLLENPSAPNAKLMAIVTAWHEEPVTWIHDKKHPREAFDCGEEALNEFPRR